MESRKQHSATLNESSDSSRKQAIMSALDAFVRQRPGLEFGNYGDGPAYRAEARSIARTLKDYRQLERYVLLHDGIDAEALLTAASSAYSGRLSLAENWHQFTADECPGRPCGTGCDHRQFRGHTVGYCTGQYWPTEYRRAACAVLAAAIWADTSARNCAAPGKPASESTMAGMSAGNWIRRTLRAEFGTPIARRWFDWDL